MESDLEVRVFIHVRITCLNLSGEFTLSVVYLSL